MNMLYAEKSYMNIFCSFPGVVQVINKILGQNYTEY